MRSSSPINVTPCTKLLIISTYWNAFFTKPSFISIFHIFFEYSSNFEPIAHKRMIQFTKKIRFLKILSKLVGYVVT